MSAVWSLLPACMLKDGMEIARQLRYHTAAQAARYGAAEAPEGAGGAVGGVAERSGR